MVCYHLSVVVSISVNYSFQVSFNLKVILLRGQNNSKYPDLAPLSLQKNSDVSLKDNLALSSDYARGFSKLGAKVYSRQLYSKYMLYLI